MSTNPIFICVVGFGKFRAHLLRKRGAPPRAALNPWRQSWMFNLALTQGSMMHSIVFKTASKRPMPLAQIVDLCLATCCMGAPIHGPTFLFGDNKSVVNAASVPHSELHKCHNALSCHRTCEVIAADIALLPSHCWHHKHTQEDILGSVMMWCQPRGHCASVDDHGAGSECSVLIHYSHNSHSLFIYSVDLSRSSWPWAHASMWHWCGSLSIFHGIGR